jgi:hypothetical protein
LSKVCSEKNRHATGLVSNPFDRIESIFEVVGGIERASMVEDEFAGLRRAISIDPGDTTLWARCASLARRVGLPYYARYLSGEHLAVWEEILRLDDFAEESPAVKKDVSFLIEETLNRAHYNFKAIESKLESENFRSLSPLFRLSMASPESVELIRAIELEIAVISRATESRNE